jgi:hypothetical protein
VAVLAWRSREDARDATLAVRTRSASVQLRTETYCRRVVGRCERSHIEIEVVLECGHLVHVFPDNGDPEIAYCVWCEQAALGAAEKGDRTRGS